jgi:antitoxin component of MazEF toxin-antitoxin module
MGNSLAIRLPASVVEQLGLHEGDEIEIEIAGPRHSESVVTCVESRRSSA